MNLIYVVVMLKQVFLELARQRKLLRALRALILAFVLSHMLGQIGRMLIRPITVGALVCCVSTEMFV